MCFCGGQHRRFICPRLLSSDDASTFAERKKKKGRRGTKRRERIYSLLPPVRSPEGGCPQKLLIFSLHLSVLSLFGRRWGGKFSRPSLFVDNTTELRCTHEKKLGDCTTQVCYVRSTPPSRRQEDRGDSAECLCVVQSTQYPSPLFSPERMRGKTMCALCRCVGLSQDG